MSGETVYSRAAERIRQRGWVQDVGRGPDGEACLVRALSEAGQSLVGPLLAIKAHLGLGVGDALVRWNDAPERTVEDVLMVLKEMHVEAGGS